MPAAEKEQEASIAEIAPEMGGIETMRKNAMIFTGIIFSFAMSSGCAGDEWEGEGWEEEPEDGERGLHIDGDGLNVADGALDGLNVADGALDGLNVSDGALDGVQVHGEGTLRLQEPSDPTTRAGWLGPCYQERYSNRAGGWCDGNGPNYHYRGVVNCNNGYSYGGIWRWAGDRRKSFGYCPSGKTSVGGGLQTAYFN